MVYSPATMRAEKTLGGGQFRVSRIRDHDLEDVSGVTTGSLGILSEAAHSAWT